MAIQIRWIKEYVQWNCYEWNNLNWYPYYAPKISEYELYTNIEWTLFLILFLQNYSIIFYLISIFYKFMQVNYIFLIYKLLKSVTVDSGWIRPNRVRLSRIGSLLWMIKLVLKGPWKFISKFSDFFRGFTAVWMSSRLPIYDYWWEYHLLR